MNFQNLINLTIKKQVPPPQKKTPNKIKNNKKQN